MDYSSMVERAAKDMDALEQLYLALGHDVFAVAYGILRDTHAAEDVVQETFVRLSTAAARYSRKGDGRAFVLKIARNTALEFYRKKKRLLLTEDGESIPQRAEGGDFSTPLIVNEALGKLGVREREVILLRFFSDLTFKQIAAVTAAPEGTVKWRYNKAIKKLRAFLEVEEDEYGYQRV